MSGLEPSLEPRNPLEPLLEHVEFFDLSTPRINLCSENGTANDMVLPMEICSLCGEPSGRALSHWFCSLCMNKPPVIEMINYKSLVHTESVFSNVVENTEYHRIDTPRVCPSSPSNSLHSSPVPKTIKTKKNEVGSRSKSKKNKKRWNRWA